MTPQPRALVLGGTGFIGGHIVKQLAGNGWEIDALRRDPEASGHVGGIDVRWHTGNLDKPETLVAPMNSAKVVFHAAGYVPPDSRDVPGKVARSVQQTRNVCEAARHAGTEKMVYTSTLTTIGTPPQGSERLADERDGYLPGSVSASAYFECKYAMESEMLRYAAAGLPVVIVNPTFVLGPEGAEDTIRSLVRLIASGWGRISIAVDQNAVDVRDAARGHVQAADRGRIGERYILGGTNVRVDALMSQLAALMDAVPPTINLPTRWLRLVARATNFGSLGAMSNHLFGIEHWQALSTHKAESELGYRSRPLQETLNDTIQWYRERGDIP